MVEVDQLEAAAKKHRLKLEAEKEKQLRRKREKLGIVEFKEDQEEEKYNPYDEDQKNYEEAAKAEIQFEERRNGSDEEEGGDNSYDSEFEAEFFGNKNPEANDLLDKLQSEQQKRQEEERLQKIEENEKKKAEKLEKKRQEQLAAKNFEKLEDLNQELKKAAEFKPVEGVSYVKYDQFGIKIDPDDEARKYIADVNDNQGFSEFIPAVGDQY